MSETRPLAVVTGASSGIGYELAKLCVEHGYDLAIAAGVTRSAFPVIVAPDGPAAGARRQAERAS
jgi:NAD(P)-dependent dehydrogenase (short-subunit alcohol dehydrogenase family)